MRWSIGCGSAKAGSSSTRAIAGRGGSPSFIQHRLSEHRPPVSYFLMPWRDFALSAFVTEVGMPSLAPAVATDDRARAEFDLAARVTSSTWTRMLSTDLLVVVGCKPTERREAELLDRTLANRQVAAAGDDPDDAGHAGPTRGRVGDRRSERALLAEYFWPHVRDGVGGDVACRKSGTFHLRTTGSAQADRSQTKSAISSSISRVSRSGALDACDFARVTNRSASIMAASSAPESRMS